MNKIIILHRDDLYGLTRSEPIVNIVYESFPDPLLKFLDADFIAFEDDRTGLLKILKNNFGACVVMPCASFYVALHLMTRPEAMNLFPEKPKIAIEPSKNAPLADWGKDQAAKGLSGDIQVLLMPNEENTKPKPNYSVGFDPAAVGCDVSAFVVRDNGVVKYIGRSNDPEKFRKEALNMAQYYGENLVVDFSYLIDQKVKEAADIFNGQGYFLARDKFPEDLTTAILYFNRDFDNVFKIMFQHTEIYFTSTLQVSYPELYADIKKECGFWCKDTPLYKELLNYGGDHEEFMLNTILKGIYRFRNYGRNKSNDIYDIIESANPNKKQS